MNKAAQKLGRLGGKKTSEAKAAAAKANGAKGGRPRKTPKAEPPSEPANDKLSHDEGGKNL
jgi:hypothetical protein